MLDISQYAYLCMQNSSEPELTRPGGLQTLVRHTCAGIVWLGILFDLNLGLYILQGHAPQFWYCETCKMGMIHSCPPDSAAPRPSGSCYDHGSLGLNSSALEFKGCKPASKSYDNELCTLSKLRSSPLLSWMAACCLIGASALAL